MTAASIGAELQSLSVGPVIFTTLLATVVVIAVVRQQLGSRAQ
jgi:hypothetical protein